jgi:hypothetical protein
LPPDAAAVEGTDQELARRAIAAIAAVLGTETAE